jgi:hypothetical protein
MRINEISIYLQGEHRSDNGLDIVICTPDPDRFDSKSIDFEKAIHEYICKLSSFGDFGTEKIEVLKHVLDKCSIECKKIISKEFDSPFED